MPAPFQDITWWIILDFYIIFILVYFLLRFVLHNKRMLSLAIFYLCIVGIFYLINYIGTLVNHNFAAIDFYWYMVVALPLFIAIVGAPEIRFTLESLWKETVRQSALVMGSERTKSEIVKATQYLAKHQIGALMTIEKHNTLDQYSQRAIQMNSDVSSELLLNIFTPNTPLHDGAVIIRGDKILCAGAYYVLSSNDSFEKTTGSRHRAALGISEITDSLTIVVSEETGSISIAINGVMTKMNDQEVLLEYLNLFMR